MMEGCGMHAGLGRQLSLHDNGLHHVGQAAWVAPLLAARLLGYGEETAARAINLSAPAFIAPAGFSRGHLANVKALAYGLIARRGVNMTLMARDGLAAQDGACDQVVRLLSGICGRAIGLEIGVAGGMERGSQVVKDAGGSGRN